MPTSNIKNIQKILLVLGTLQPTFVYAYIDPSSTGLIFQLLTPLLAAVLGGLVFMRRAISGFFQKLWQQFFGKNPS